MQNNFLKLILSLSISSQLFAQTPIASWHLDESAGLFAKENLSGTDFIIWNNYPKIEAEWLPGVAGNALRLNGSSTWVEGALNTALPNQQLSISAWVAPEVWPINTAAIFTSVNLNGGGAYLAIDKFGRLEVAATINGSLIKKVSAAKIPVWKWSHLAMTADVSTGKMRGFINGILVLEQNIAAGMLGWPNPTTLKLGKFHIQSMSGIYETGLFCGLIDEIKIYNQALSPTQLAAIVAAEMPVNSPELRVPATRFEGDFHRPIYHAIPAANWMNEPHGLIFYNGLYHIFYQKNGNGPYWGRLNWGHQTSPDLVTWTEQKVVLSPDPDGYDKEGCWSGVSFLKDTKAYIMYTGVDGVTAQMCLAEANADASEYQKFSNNPVVQAPPAPYTPNDFRDPFIWQENGAFYMIIGTGNSTGGAALLYKSTDHINWTYLYTLKKGVQAADNSGVFWEVPMFLKFGNKRVFTAQPIPYNGVPARILYWTGIFENEVFTSDQIQPKQLEPGDALLGVTTTLDTDGRTIAIGIIPDILPDYEQRKNGWAHLMSLPRVWSLSTDGNTLLQKPLPELQKLRGLNHHFEQLQVADGQTNSLSGIQGRYLEVRTSILPGTATKAGIILAKSADNLERTRVYWDIVAGILIIDRVNSSTNPSVPKTFLTANLSQTPGQPLDLQIFLDGSVLEVFINQEKALSTRIYPEKPESVGVDVFASGGMATFEGLDLWEMKSMYDPSVTSIKAPVFQKKSLGNTIERIYPNPTTGRVDVEITKTQSGSVILKVQDLSGRLIQEKQFDHLPVGTQFLELDNLEGIPAGAFFITLWQNNQQIGSGQFIKQ